MPTPQPNKNKPEEREVQDVQRHNPKQHIQMILREALSNLPTSRRTSLCIATSRASMWLSTARRRALGSYWAVWSHTLPSIGLKQLKQNTANRECMRWQNRLGRIVWGMHALVDVHSLCQNAHCIQKRAVQVESSFSKMPHSYRLFFHSCVPALFQSWIRLLVLLLLLSDGLQLSLSQIWPYLPSLHETKTRSNWLMARSYKVPRKGSQWWSHQRAGAIFPNRHYVSLNSCLLSPFLLCLQTRWPIMPHRLGRLGCLYWYTLGCRELTSEDR